MWLAARLQPARIAVGVAVLVWPGISALALLYVIGAYAIALGIVAIGGALELPIAAFALITGITEVVVAIGGERLLDSGLKRTFAPKPKPQATCPGSSAHSAASTRSPSGTVARRSRECSSSSRTGRWLVM